MKSVTVENRARPDLRVGRFDSASPSLGDILVPQSLIGGIVLIAGLVAFCAFMEFIR